MLDDHVSATAKVKANSVVSQFFLAAQRSAHSVHQRPQLCTAARTADAARRHEGNGRQRRRRRRHPFASVPGLVTLRGGAVCVSVCALIAIDDTAGNDQYSGSAAARAAHKLLSSSHSISSTLRFFAVWFMLMSEGEGALDGAM